MSQTKTCEKKIKTAELKITKILSKINTLKLNDSNIVRLDVETKKVGNQFFAGILNHRFLIPAAFLVLLSVLWWLYSELSTKVLVAFVSTPTQQSQNGGDVKYTCGLLCIFLLSGNKDKDHGNDKKTIPKIHIHSRIPRKSLKSHYKWRTSVTLKNCFLSLPSSSKALFRPPEDCSMCIGVDDVTRIANITAQEFEELYAYNTVPVIVTDATKDWRAIKEFDFKFFRGLYQRSLGRQTGECFFFAYNSGLRSLSEVFAMDERRANLSGDPWYVGWSTCLEGETRALREYYSRPYFLPRAAESDAVDWLFMGGPGQGAHMHVDSVRHVSWQAQVRGRKRWQLAPPPECLHRCRWLTFTVRPGEILVVDTNRWYHRTTVLPGDISITIGAEYD